MKPIGHTILRYDEVTSTNTLILDDETLLSNHGLVMLARHQTAGRGRMGRIWASIPGAQLQFSVVVHPRVPDAQVPVVALIAGLAVARGIARATDLRPVLRWPNDVFLDGRKVCGILVEAKPDAQGRPRLVVGIGINCQGRAEDFPPEVRPILTTLAQSRGAPVDNEAVLQAVLEELERLLERLAAGEQQALLEEWQRHAQFRGARVRWRSARGPVEAVVEGLNAEGFLTARDDQGRSHTVVSSELEWLQPGLPPQRIQAGSQ
jgi:BirA family biotin operon repressor/biotin-[acetyl-CoA-carboxylase] ligase